MIQLFFGSLLLFLSASVSAQYGDTPVTTSPQPSPSAAADVAGQINVDVAFQGSLVFHPANITAPKGTVVTFSFPNGGITHSVTQSSFNTPCIYLAANGSSPAGFDSGLTSGKQFSITIVDDTKPIWYYCKQASHCGAGMVGSINAPTSGSNTFDAFLTAAKSVGSQEPTVTDGGPVTGGVNGVATAPPSVSSSGSYSSTQTPNGGSNGSNAGVKSAIPSLFGGIVAFGASMWLY